MKLAVFDLDNTLLNGDSDYAWGQFMVAKGLVDRDHYTRENDRFYAAYKNKTLDIHEYQRFVLTPLIGFDAARREALHAEFMATVVSELRQSKADSLVHQHRQQGDELLIITATNRFIAGPIGPWLGIDNILATDPQEVDGQFTGNIDGVPCFQEGKITRMQQWLEQQQVQPQWLTFYSDSINDLPLLEYADTAVAVDPDKRLQAHAEAQNWSVISLRD